MQRTEIDFSKHEIIVTKNSWELNLENKKMLGIKFTNIDEVMLVTGDFGNWIFCRQWVPCLNTKVSEGYWIEKLKNGSSQIAGAYSPEKTLKAIEEKIAELHEEPYSDNEDIQNEYLEYLEEMKGYVHDELDYTYHAYRDKPEFLEYEDVIFIKKINPQLQVVFDAWDYLCDRMESGQK